MTHEELCQMLYDMGYETGWAMTGDRLLLWFHEEDPPAPLTRPEPEPAPE